MAMPATVAWACPCGCRPSRTVSSDAYLKQTIRLGRPGRVMPRFDHLSAAEVEAIVEHIRGWHDGDRPVFSQARIEGDVQRGARLFSQHCAQCHGEQGEGGQGTGVTFSRPRDLPIIAPALNNPGFLAAASDAMIKATLMQGREGTPMASFREQGLSEEQINDLVAYVRSFEGEHTDPAPRVEEIEPTLVYDSPYGLEETVEAVERAAVGKNFRLIRRQKLEEGLFPEGEENDRQVIVYFCNFNFLYDALTVDPRVGLFLPCRVTVVEQEGQVRVMTINPKRLSVLFNNERLDQACDEMHRIYTDILEEATF
ncbi:c-type cytochrome [Thiohalobacter thiocyanaticus]|uniref:c-type cytochrome n=1 Tax=Thiohalobacter thiocyanaticus TaxID=585455 RepID=UPI0019D4570A|nr:c-type cytochrome [Thiohalobacter thiocyanaticus]